MWGLGASVGPYIMGAALSGGMGWDTGYRYISVFQILLTAVIFLSLPLWKARPDAVGEDGKKAAPLTMKQILAIPGAKEVLLAFFCYCAAEQTAILWSATYLVEHVGMHEEIAASFASMFLIGLTVGRGISGFITYKLNDTNMIRLGEGIMILGVIVMVLPLGQYAALVGLMLFGLGCAPIYPCVIHSTPDHFGAENSQAIIGVQMAAAYVGICLMPPLFGLIANHITVALMPLYLALITVTMIVMCERLNRKHER